MIETLPSSGNDTYGLGDVYVQLNERDEPARCQRPIDEDGDSFDNKRKKEIPNGLKFLTKKKVSKCYF